MKNSARPARAFQLLALALVCCFLLLGADAAAQANVTVFTFEGRLTDAGSPAEGLYDLQFALYDAPKGGMLLATLVRDDVVATQGVFTVRLDFGADVFTKGAGRYLEIGVRPGASDGEFTTLEQREELTAAPYAIQAIHAEKADSAERLGGSPASSFLRSDTSQTFDGGVLNIGAGSALNVNGALLGSGANLTDLNAANVAAGTLNDNRLSTNVVLRNRANAFSSIVLFDLPPFMRGTNITDLRADNVATGTLNDARLSSNIPRLSTGNTFSAANNNFTGTISTNGLNVGGGLPVRRILTASATLDFGGSTVYQEVLNIRVIGARVGDAVYLGVPANVLPIQNYVPPRGGPATPVTQPFVFQAYVSSPDTVSVTWNRLVANDGTSSGSIARSACLEGLRVFDCQPPPGVFRVVVFSFAP